MRMQILFCIASLFFFSTAFSQNIIYHEKVETEPKFGNNSYDWYDYLQQNINENIPVLNCAPPGKYTVELNFLIGRNGKVEYLIQRTHLGYGMESELMRVIKNAPSWIPATQNGRAVRNWKCQSFTFTVPAINNALL